MQMPRIDKVFTGAIPKLYETYLVPLIFEPYARDLATRVASHDPARVLEIAAGTGVVTRAMASVLPDPVTIVATDLNPAMLEQAATLGTARSVEWRQGTPCNCPSVMRASTSWRASSARCSFQTGPAHFAKRAGC